MKQLSSRTMFSHLDFQNLSSLVSGLQGLTKAKNEKLRAAANGCLWTIRDLKSQKQKKAEARKSGKLRNVNRFLSANLRNLQGTNNESVYR